MVALVWGQAGQRFYQAGVDRGVLYPLSGSGVVWNGLVSVNEVVVGGTQKPIHIDGVKVMDIIQSEDFQIDVTAFSAPAEFQAFDGHVSIAPGLIATMQPRIPFNFCYRTKIGNDIKKQDYGYKIHLVYNVTAAPAARNNSTLSDSVEAEPLSWSFHTVPPKSTLYKPTSHLIVDVSVMTANQKLTIENILYGTSTTNPTFPSQAALISILSAA